MIGGVIPSTFSSVYISYVIRIRTDVLRLRPSKQALDLLSDLPEVLKIPTCINLFPILGIARVRCNLR
jgi:hypothetical protein